MSGLTDRESPFEKQREQMLKLVTRGFYNELMKYGVRREEIVRVASHLLDNLLTQDGAPSDGIEYYNTVFTLADVQDEWEERRRLTVHDVSIRPLEPDVLPELFDWLKAPVVRDSFVPHFPETPSALAEYFRSPTREYFSVFYAGQVVGIVGCEMLDAAAGKLEMRKLIGRAGLRGRGIGKRATFAFLYYAFVLRDVHKVVIHSSDVNIRNIRLNSRFGFELEGVFFEDFVASGRRRDLVRMALFRDVWLRIFGRCREQENAPQERNPLGAAAGAHC